MLLISSVIAFLTTCLFIWTLQPVAHRISLVDKPGGRKKHDGNIPLIGGIAIFFGLIVGLLLCDQPVADYKGLLVAGGILLIVGTVDDYIDLRASARFLAQITAAFIIIFADGILLTDLGNLFGTGALELGWFSTVFTLLAIVGVINATNMSDGMDGLAGGLSVVTVLALSIISYAQNQVINPLYLIILSTLVSFLLFNMRYKFNPSARIFIGNGGSMLLGLMLAWVLIHSTQSEPSVIAPVTALWIFALPLLDTVCIMIRRIMKGQSPFAPDREHFHHILLVAGYSVKQSVWIMIGIASLLAIVGYVALAANIPEQVLFFGMLGLFGLYFWGMSHAWRVMKAIRVEH